MTRNRTGRYILGALCEQARTSAVWRGHDLARWHKSPHERGGTVARAKCKACDAWVTVITTPSPNEIDIGGPAVAVGCPWRDPALARHESTTRATGQPTGAGHAI